jgi:hypothetical protein
LVGSDNGTDDIGQVNLYDLLAVHGARVVNGNGDVKVIACADFLGRDDEIGAD